MYNTTKIIEKGGQQYRSAERGCNTILIEGLSLLAFAELDVYEDHQKMRMIGCTPEDRAILEGYKV